MSGRGTRFLEAGYKEPKPLIPVDGRPIIAHLLDQFPEEWPKTFVCSREHLVRTPLREVLVSLAPGCTIVPIGEHSKGPVFAVLEACRLAPESVPEGEPCVVNYCDFTFSWDPWRFEDFTTRTRCDAAVVCYSGFHPEYLRPTLYAYCRHEDGRVLEVKEKGHFTKDRTREPASSGTYYFRSGQLVRQSFERIMREGPLINGEGYVSLACNQLARDGSDVRLFEIPWFMQWGTPADLHDYEYWSRIYSGGRKPPIAAGAPLQLLMPMAGRGSRFGAGTPKFMRPVMGRPMFRSAIEHLPRTDSQVVVVLAEHREAAHAAAPDAQVVSIAALTEGQAATCALGGSALRPDVPVLVSSCDHGLVWDDDRWRALLAQEPDVVVFGQRNYPGADATPNAFAYIAAEGDRITRVSVKQPLGAHPRDDLLLVGTFYFRRPALMLDLIDELRRKDVRVNGELYLDSVVNLAVARGLAARVFETDGYLCWGTPDALREFEYWHGWFNGRAAPGPGEP